MVINFLDLISVYAKANETNSDGDGTLTVFWMLSILFMIIVIVLLMSGVKIIQPYEQGLLIVLGNFKAVLNPGFNFVPPLISAVIKVDLREQRLDLPPQEFLTKEGSKVIGNGLIICRVEDVKKSYFEIKDWKVAIIGSAIKNLSENIGNMEYKEVFRNIHTINSRVKDGISKDAKNYGIFIFNFEFKFSNKPYNQSYKQYSHRCPKCGFVFND